MTQRPAENSTIPALRIAGISADYGQGAVIEDISFDVRQGECFGLVGLNGVGKTTLIKIVLGLLQATAGAAEIFGQRVLDPAAKEKIAYLPEKFEPPVFLSGLEFIEFSLSLYNRGFDEAEVLAAADRVALSRGSLKRRVHTYSKGMRQKTGLIGTWMTGCPLLILDEPMSGLDPRARVQVKDELLACKARGMTVFLSSHILADMDEMCDRIAVIHDAGLPFLGTPAEMRARTGEQTLERAFLSVIADSKRVYES